MRDAMVLVTKEAIEVECREAKPPKTVWALLPVLLLGGFSKVCFLFILEFSLLLTPGDFLLVFRDLLKLEDPLEETEREDIDETSAKLCSLFIGLFL